MAGGAFKKQAHFLIGHPFDEIEIKSHLLSGKTEFPGKADLGKIIHGMRDRRIARRDGAIGVDADHADIAQFCDCGGPARQLRREHRDRHARGAITQPRCKHGIEHRKRIGRKPAVAIFRFKKSADDSKWQEAFFLQALDSA